MLLSEVVSHSAVQVAKTEKEICSLIEAVFEYVTEFEGAKIFRKRKL